MRPGRDTGMDCRNAGVWAGKCFKQANMRDFAFWHLGSCVSPIAILRFGSLVLGFGVLALGDVVTRNVGTQNVSTPSQSPLKWSLTTNQPFNPTNHSKHSNTQSQFWNFCPFPARTPQVTVILHALIFGHSHGPALGN